VSLGEDGSGRGAEEARVLVVWTYGLRALRAYLVLAAVLAVVLLFLRVVGIATF